MNQLDLIIKNATVVLTQDIPNQLETHFKRCLFHLEKNNVGIKDGKIQYIGNENIPSSQIIDGKGLHLIPGIIDSQVHFREPGLIHKEDLSTGSQAAAMGGITTFFEMPNTSPATTTQDLFNEKLLRASKKSFVNYAFFIGATQENLSRISELEKLPHCAGIKVFVGSSTGNLLLSKDEDLEELFKNSKRRIIFHSEDEDRMQSRKNIVLDSKDVKMHPVWRDEESALNSTKKLLALAEKYQRPIHLLHITSAAEIELIEKYQKRLGKLISCEVLPQHLYFFAPDCYEKWGTLVQQNPPIREKKHQEALWKALESGIVTVMGSDHAPHTLEEKNKEYPQSPSGIPGVQTLLPLLLHFVSQNKMTIEKIVELMCENPRQVFGFSSKGRIEIGLDADLTLIDLNKSKKIENKNMKSRSGWTPFNGLSIKGWPVATLVNGIPVMQNDQILGTPRGRAVDFNF